jgi:anthranilate synthase/aminodeoxychorismate synthase-like glutamine amidotransferase
MAESAPTSARFVRPEGPVDTLMIDNYDSFTFNLVQYLEQLGTRVTTVRNDAVTLEDIEAMAPRRIIISPGPGAPRDAGISCDTIRHFAGRVPIFGVCLGLQCMYEVFGGTVTHAGEIVHGKTSEMTHDGKGVFRDIPSPFKAVRYHSLAGTKPTLPDVLEVSCRCVHGIRAVVVR